MELKETAVRISIKDVKILVEGEDNNSIEKMSIELKTKLQVIFDGKIFIVNLKNKIAVTEPSLIKHISENSNQIIMSVG